MNFQTQEVKAAPNQQPDSKLRAGLFVFRSVESDDIHIPSAIVDTELVCMRPACMIAVVGAVNSHNSATGASSGAVLTKFLGPDQLAVRRITTTESLASIRLDSSAITKYNSGVCL